LHFYGKESTSATFDGQLSAQRRGNLTGSQFNLQAMKQPFVKSGLLFALVIFLLGACSLIPKGPSDEIVINDWNTFIKANSAKYCVSMNKFEILGKSMVKSEYYVTVRISGQWNCQNDTILVTGPCNLFDKNKGKNQTAEVNMVYVTENQDWIFKGFIPK
jgi:hypothetical protein